MTAAQAAQLADRYARQIADSVRWVSDNPDPYGKAIVEMHIEQALNDGRPSTTPLPPAPKSPKKQREADYIAMDGAVRRLWMRNRIAYDVDPDLWEELGHTAEETEIPEGLFDKLPHPDPFVALPKPLVVQLDKTSQMRIEGFFVTGRGVTLAETQVSTHSPAAVGNIGLLIGGAVETLSGRPKMVPGQNIDDFIWNRVTLRRDIRHLSQYIYDIRARFDRAPEAGDFDQVLPAAITACVSALIYLCSTNAELRPVPAAVVKRAMKGTTSKPPKVIEVGYITGPKLRAYRQRERGTSVTQSSRTVRAHIRRAHFHTFLVGPGRSEKIVKWLAPFLVGGIQGQEDAAKTTVVGVE